MLLQITIQGESKPKQSFRRTNSGHCYQKPEIAAEEKRLAFFIKKQLPKDFQISKEKIIVKKLWFVFEPPKSLKKKELEFIENGGFIPKTTKPDLDNLEKLLFDAMQGVVFVNDSQIYKKEFVLKLYGKEPKIIVEMEV